MGLLYDEFDTGEVTKGGGPEPVYVMRTEFWESVMCAGEFTDILVPVDSKSDLAHGRSDWCRD